MTWLVDLLPVKRGGDIDTSGRFAKANANGEYEFSGVPPANIWWA